MSITSLWFIARASRSVCRRTGTLSRYRQRGAGLLGLAVAGILAILLGMATLQFGMLYFFRHDFNHAVFMAARTGALAHANIETIQQAYIHALVPLYVQGQRTGALTDAKIRAKDVVTGSNDAGANPQHAYARIALENPTRESFLMWNSPILQYTIGGGSRVIPHSAQVPRATGSRADPEPSLRQANLIRLRVIQGYQPTIPWMGRLYNHYLARQDNHNDPAYTELLGRGLIPLVTTVTLPMQSDAIERLTVPRSRVTDCTSVHYPHGCLRPGCLPADIRCDPVCTPPSLCSMPALPKE